MSAVKILICDDHHICCLGLRLEIENFLKEWELDFVFAFTAKQALEEIQKTPFHFLFMDLKLPDASGLSVIRAAQARLEQTRVTVVTGETNGPLAASIQEASKTLPIHGILHKSHSADELAALMDHYKRDEATIFLCRHTKEILTESVAADLTPRELDVIKLVTKGLTTPEIAGMLGCSNETVKSHRANMLAKTKTRNIAELSAWYSSRYL